MQVFRTHIRSRQSSSLLTLDAVEVGGGQRLSLALICRDALVLGLLSARHVACAPALLQIVAAAGGGHPGQWDVLRLSRLGSGAGSVGRGGFTR